MVVWQNTLNARHEFELLTQQKTGGRKWRWQRGIDPVGKAARMFKLLLAQRLRQIADRLEAEARRWDFTSTSVEKLAMATTASHLPLTRTVERFGSTSSVTRFVQ